MATYDYKRHRQTARIQALSDLLKTVKDIKEPSWAEKEAIKLENDMLLAKHKAEIAIEDRENKLFDEYKKLDEATAAQLSKDKYLEGILGKDPTYKPDTGSGQERRMARRRKRKKGKIEGEAYGIGRLWGGEGDWLKQKRYRKFRQGDFAQMLPDMTTRIGAVSTKVATAGTISDLTGGKAIAAKEEAKSTVQNLYNQLYSSSYQREFLTYATAQQRQEYFTGLAEMHGMMNTLGLAVPSYDVLSEYEQSITTETEY